MRHFTDKPDVTLKIGRGLNATGINAGSDVYLECSVQEILLEQGGQAMNNHVITWKHNGKVLKVSLFRHVFMLLFNIARLLSCPQTTLLTLSIRADQENSDAVRASVARPLHA